MKKMRKKQVLQVVDCDTTRLFNVDLKKAANYLLEVYEEHPMAELDEHWTGYEDMEIRFIYYRMETDEECKAREYREAQQKAW